ncbi:hypothetical protein GCM10023149_05270 [Mucilaginibacter gynuensis]|uniref:Dienelactone hydrolase domain-containing protein n=1 Tax=Mucilaginibacter gynuensis TaxID=1302236 RepID=A0ABP8FTP3_9SPHI
MVSAGFAQKRLNKKQAELITAKALDSVQRAYQQQAWKNWNSKQIKKGDLVMKFEYVTRGAIPKNGHSLYISLHGGGGTAPEVNDQQWKNQITLYAPPEGIYLAPRAPTNNWNLWHEEHVDDMLDELIKSAIVAASIDPDKVYLMGYSAGGDGTYQLAPRMSYRFAAAAMMAGHPGDMRLENLRNLPFSIYMGGKDAAYSRNKLAKIYGDKLDSLQNADPAGYQHETHIYPENPHWMEHKDTVAVKWMAALTRNPLPNKVVWIQDDRHHADFYWLSVPQGVKTGAEVSASIKDNIINIEKKDNSELYIYLNDKLLNLNKPVTVIIGGKVIFKGKINRSEAVITETAARYLDAGLTFSAKIIIKEGKVIN